MIKRNLAIFFFVLIIGSFFTNFASASIPNWGQNGLVTCSGAKLEGLEKPLEQCKSFKDILATAKNIYEFLITVALLVAAPIFLLAGGIMLAASGANPGLHSKGVAYIKTAIIGSIIILLAYALVNTFVSVIDKENKFFEGFGKSLKTEFVLTAYADEIEVSIPGTTSSSSPIEMIKGFYQFSLAISGALAVAVIVYGAVKYMASPGSPSGQGEAREWITSALLGILLLAGAYIILNTINPELTILRLPTLDKLKDSNYVTPNLLTTYAVVEKNGEENIPLPKLQCSRTLNECSSQKNQLIKDNPTKSYDCVQINANRIAWCSSSVLEPIPTGEICATGNCVKIDFPGWIIKNGSSVDKKMYDVLSCIAGSGFPLRVTEAMPPTVVHQSVRHNNGCAIDATLQIVTTKADCSKLAELQSAATGCGAARFLNEYVNLCKGTPYEGTKTEGGNADHVHIEASCGR